MITRQDELRITRGLLGRLSAFCPNQSAPDESAASTIAGRVNAFMRQPKGRNRPRNDQLDVQLINLGLRLKTITDQSRIFDIASDALKLEVLRVLTIGEQFTQTCAPAAFEDLSDIDYSLTATRALVELIRNSRNGLSKLIQKQISEHMIEIGFASPSNTAELSRNLAVFVPKVNLQTIADIGDGFYSLKQAAWPLFGSDLLTFIHGLADPNASFSEAQLETLYGLAECWKLGSVAAKLIMLRSLNGYPERVFVDKHMDELRAAANFSFEILDQLPLDESSYAEAVYAYNKSTDPIEGAILFSILFYRYLDRRDYNKVLNLIQEQYERDPSALWFLNWDEFHAKMPNSWGQQYLINILLSVTMLSPIISSRFESIEFSYGEGFIANQILNFVHSFRGQSQPLLHFTNQINLLGPKAKDRVGRFVLHKSIVEIYANEFAQGLLQRLRSVTLDASQKVAQSELVVCNTRLQLASMFRERKILPADHCDRIIQEESAFRKILRFQQVFRNSRIRIDWKSLEAEIVDSINLDFGFLFNRPQSSKATLNSSVADIVATMVGERICELSLFESTTCLERALSNNLRHGVVIPRFLKAFIEAIAKQSGARAPTDGKNKTWYENTFPLGAKRFLQLEEEIISAVTEYQEHWLRAEREGVLYQQLVERVSSSFLKSVSKGAGFTLRELATEIIEIMKASISHILAISRETLNGEVRAKIEKLVSLASIDIGQYEEKGAREFIDTLSISLTDAIEEAARWISLYDSESSDSLAFDIKDLVDEEASTLFIADRAKTSIKFESYERVGSKRKKLKEVKVSGRSFELFDQIIHNCLSNALGKSGLGRETKIHIRITREQDSSIVWIANTFAPENFPTMVQNQEKAKRIIADAVKQHDGKAGRKKRLSINKEGGFGLMKIMDACERLCGALPQFNFPILPPEANQFIVEIRLPHSSSVFL